MSDNVDTELSTGDMTQQTSYGTHVAVAQRYHISHLAYIFRLAEDRILAFHITHHIMSHHNHNITS